MQPGVTIRSPKELSTALSQVVETTQQIRQNQDAISEGFSAIASEAITLKTTLEILPEAVSSFSTGIALIKDDIAKGFGGSGDTTTKFVGALAVIQGELVQIAEAFLTTGRLTDEQAARVEEQSEA